MIDGTVREHFADAGRLDPSGLVDALCEIIKSSHLSDHFTGFIVAGFGSAEKFPSLFSFELDGYLLGKLKVRIVDYIDIDREGKRAAIVPFAQNDMVERFLYGLDDDIRRGIVQYCEGTVASIRQAVMNDPIFEDEEVRRRIAETLIVAEGEFINQLQTQAFDEIRKYSISDIEGMVEFMPKPDLARTAEALIELTSIKRRVSAGVETVGGPWT